MRKLVFVSILSSLLALPVAGVFADEAVKPVAEASAAPFSTATTPLGDILDNPAACAIVDKYVPDMSKSDQIDLARAMTLQDIQMYSPDALTDEVLEKMDAEFAKLAN
jgi:hypothetical protein